MMNNDHKYMPLINNGSRFVYERIKGQKSVWAIAMLKNVKESKNDITGQLHSLSSEEILQEMNYTETEGHSMGGKIHTYMKKEYLIPY